MSQRITWRGEDSGAAVLAIIIVSYLMIVLDISITITGLPRIDRDLGFSEVGLSWVQSAYTLAFGGLLLLGARAGDILGRRRMFIAGLAVFTLASLAVGVAWSPAVLIAARALQGAGAAILAPSTLALLSSAFPEGPERSRAVAYYGAVAGLGASVGLVLGGFLADAISWRAGFFINLPIGVALVVAARRWITETERRPGRFDLPGAATSTAGMTLLVYGIVRSAAAGWADPITLAALFGAVTLLAAFVANERRADQPILPLRLFASAERSGAYAARILYLGAMLGFFFFVTQFLQGVVGLSPLGAGFAFLPMTLANVPVAVRVPQLTRRFGHARLLAAGVTLTLVGMAWLSRLDAGTPYLTGVALPMLLVGIGQGATLGPLTGSGIAGVPAQDAGAAGGVTNVAHQLGGSLGLGILVTVFAAAGSPALDPRASLAHQVSVSLTVGAGMLAAALVLVVVLIVRPRPAGAQRLRATAPSAGSGSR